MAQFIKPQEIDNLVKEIPIAYYYKDLKELVAIVNLSTKRIKYEVRYKGETNKLLDNVTFDTLEEARKEYNGE